MSPIIEVAGVTVRRGAAVLLDDIDWTVDEADRWVVIGPNGAGKTTLMRLVAATMFPTSGRITVLGEELGRVDVFELRPRIGVCSSAMAAQIPDQEVVGDVVMSAAYAVFGRWREDYRSADSRRAAALMRELQVGHLASRTFGTLSEGERKRVQIARSLMADPELLILDEPTAGLDLAGRELLLDTLSQIVLEPASPGVVLVTHHVEEIPVGMTHAMLLKTGRIIAAGPIDDVLTPEALSETFGLELDIVQRAGRWWAQATFGARHAIVD
ncbi:MAG: ABC transporter ATP-binding protein [Propionibacteriaceae bacterium]|jgi:iron complex transport system ATP-binding protein|nr:ABC transporter ATP-binding protein [Propionibacteriaceae bacterium]